MTKRMLKLGFTGTREGLTPPQRTTLDLFIRNLFKRAGTTMVATHGDCIGADEQFHDLARAAGVSNVRVRPSNIMNFRAYTDAVQVALPSPPLDRNRLIVDECDVLIVCPRTMKEERRSGTWSTCRYARRQSCAVVIIFPDGSIVEDKELT